MPKTVAEKKIAEAATVEKYIKEWISEIEEEKEGMNLLKRLIAGTYLFLVKYVSGILCAYFGMRYK